MKIYKEKKLDLIDTYYKKYSFVPKTNSNIKVNSSFDERNLLINFSPVKSEIIKKIQASKTENFEASAMKHALQQTRFYQKSITPAQ